MPSLNVWAQEYVALRRSSRASGSPINEPCSRTLWRASPGSGSEAQEAALQERLDAVGGEHRADRRAPNRPRQAPAEASAPKPVQNTVIGAIVGLALGLALAIALERRDRRVRDPGSWSTCSAARSSAGSRAARRWPAPGAAPAPCRRPRPRRSRTVRVNLRRQLEQQGARSLIVTSAISGEGKTTLAWNLARIEAASGSRCCWSRPTCAARASPAASRPNGAAGLSDLLASTRPSSRT